MSDEFEDREAEALGELPQSILAERREFSQTDADHVTPGVPPGVPIGGLESGAHIPADVEAQHQAFAKGKGELGSPVIPASVTSVYDSRPINARDFMVTDIQFIQQPNGGAGNLQARMLYTVPEGFTGVWKRFSFEPANFAAFTAVQKSDGTEWNSVLVSLKVQNINVPDFQRMQLGQSADILMDTFVLGSAGQTFEFIIDYTSQIAGLMQNAGTDETAILMRMYGNNLVTRGLPTPFEIATQIKSGIL